MLEMVEVMCPYCGEWVEVALDPDSEGEMVQDCEVCCNPWQLTVSRDEEGTPQVEVERAQ